jgi:hypothetical protein
MQQVLAILGKHMGKIQSIVETSLAVTWDHPPCTDIEIPRVTEEWARYGDRCFDLAKMTVTSTHSEEVANVYAKCLTFHDSSSPFTVKAARDSLHAWRKEHYLGFGFGDEPMSPKDLITRMATHFTFEELMPLPGASSFAEGVTAVALRAFNDASLIRDHFAKADGREFFASDRGNIGGRHQEQKLVTRSVYSMVASFHSSSVRQHNLAIIA